MNQISLEVRKLAVLPGRSEIPAKSFLMDKLVATILWLHQALDTRYSSSSAGQSHLCSEGAEAQRGKWLSDDPTGGSSVGTVTLTFWIQGLCLFCLANCSVAL